MQRVPLFTQYDTYVGPDNLDEATNSATIQVSSAMHKVVHGVASVNTQKE